MGSWNATCQISQMPIGYGEKVRFLLLTKNPFKMDTAEGDAYSYMEKGQKKEDFGWQPNSDAGREGCYSEDFWKPEFVSVRAIYNDYGSVEDIDTESLNWSFWLDTIKNRMYELKQGSNAYHDPAVSKNMSVRDILEVLQEGRLIFNYDYKNYKVPVCQTMIREDVYQEMLGLNLKDRWSTRTRDYTPQAIFEDSLKFFTAERIEEAKKRVITDKETLEVLRKSSERLGFQYNELKQKYSSSAMVFFNAGTGFFSIEREMEDYFNWILRGLIEDKFSLNSDKFLQLLKDLSEHMFITTAYSFLRKTWHPGTGCGSQSSNYKACHDYYLKMAKIASIKEEEMNKLYEEDL